MTVLVGYVKKGRRGDNDLIFKLSDGRIGLVDKAVKDVEVHEDEVWVVSVVVSKPSYAIIRPVTKLKFKHIYPVNEVDVDVVSIDEEKAVVRVADREFEIKREFKVEQ